MNSCSNSIIIKHTITAPNNYTIKGIYVFLSVLEGILVSLIFQSACIFFYDLLGTFILLLYMRNTGRSEILALIIIKPILILAMLGLYYGYLSYYGVPYYGGGSDDLIFEQIAEHFSINNIIWPWDYSYRTNATGFYCLLSWLMGLFQFTGEYHTVAFRMLNLDFHMALALTTCKIFRRCGNFTKKQILIVLYAFALFPNAVYISSHVFRDTITSLIIATAFLLIADVIVPSTAQPLGRREKSIKICLLILLTVFGYWVRSESAFMIFAIVLISLMKENKITIKNIIPIFILFLLGLLIIDNLGFLDYISEKADRYVVHRTEDSNNAIYIAIFSMALFPFGWILRTSFGLVSPLPTGILNFFSMFSNIKVFKDVIISFGVITQIILLPFLFKNVKRIDKYTLTFVLLFMGTVLVTFTFRHPMMWYPFFAVLIFRSYFETKNAGRIKGIFYGTLTLFCATIAYFIIR